MLAAPQVRRQFQQLLWRRCMSISLCVRVPTEWGPHIRAVVITIVIVVALLLGADVANLPFLA